MRLTSLSPAAGCAAKLGMAELDELLSNAFGVATVGVGPGAAAPGATAHDIATGPDASPRLAHDELGIGDDGAIVRIGDESVVATTDFFTPIVDDAATWGHIAATNAIADVHAMGGRPSAALMVLGWPAGEHRDQLGQVLSGIRAGAAADGVVVVGGHSIDAAVPFVGLAVMGRLDGPALRQDAARPGDRLVLTAPLGTGIATTALRAAPLADAAPGGALHDLWRAAVIVMTTSNALVVDPARDHGVRAATDVTGFGLLGHLHRLARRSGVDVTVDAPRVPVLAGVVDLARDGMVPAGSRRNGRVVVADAGVVTDDTTLAVLADAQTSGGMLLACPGDQVDGLLDDLAAAGCASHEVGSVDATGTGQLTVTGRVAPTA